MSNSSTVPPALIVSPPAGGFDRAGVRELVKESGLAMTLHRLAAMRAAGEKIAMLTCYDASFARLLDNAGVDVLLVGDSLGMTLQGRDSTLPVTLADMAYHVQCVARGNRFAWIVGDLPFASYHTGTEQALLSAATLMRAGAHMVKLEGGGWTVPVVRHLVERGIPVCAHLGLTPQSVHALGGYKVQGKGEAAAQRGQPLVAPHSGR